MKTPREILLARHQAAEPKLDVIREKAVAAVCDRRTTNSPAVLDRRYNLREFLFSLRWHFAAMSAVWLAVVFLQLNIGHSTSLAAALPKDKIPSAQIIMASLRENRRELLEMIQPAESCDVRPVKLFPSQPRSDRQDEISVA